jgi:hypothetical protein
MILQVEKISGTILVADDHGPNRAVFDGEIITKENIRTLSGPQGSLIHLDWRDELSESSQSDETTKYFQGPLSDLLKQRDSKID